MTLIDEGTTCSSRARSERLDVIVDEALKFVSQDVEEVAENDKELHRFMRRAYKAGLQNMRLYGPELTFCAFNGGKDAICTLVIYLMCLETMKGEGPHSSLSLNGIDLSTRPNLLYFHDEYEFTQVVELIDDVVGAIHGNQMQFGSMIDGLRKLYQLIHNTIETTGNERQKSFSENEKTGAFNVFMGTRNTDPYSHDLNYNSLTNGNYPRFMRSNILIEFNYGLVWQFIDKFKLPYLRMYDNGYTSVGNQTNTNPNPLLRLADGSYKNARQLTEWSAERSGRVKVETTGDITICQPPKLGTQIY